MSFLDKARQAAEQARQAAAVRAQQAQQAAQVKAAQAQQMIHDQAPIIQAQTREGLGMAGANLKVAGKQAKKGMAGLVDRIDPGILADIIIKATALQEKANASLRAKGSPYRIDEITITAALPPQVGFSIARIGDTEESLTGQELESSQLIDHLAIADMSLEELAATSDGADGDGSGVSGTTELVAVGGEPAGAAAVSSAEAAASFADAAASSADAAASFADAAGGAGAAAPPVDAPPVAGSERSAAPGAPGAPPVDAGTWSDPNEPGRTGG